MTVNRAVKILTIYPRIRTGGCFGQLIRAIEAVLSRGGTVHYISSEPFPLPPDERLVFHRFPFHPRNELLFNVFFYLLCPFQILYVAITSGPVKILLFNEEFAALALPAKILSGKKIILVIEGYIKALAQNKKLNFFVSGILFVYGRIGIVAADRVFAVSEDLKIRLARFYGTRKIIGVFYNYAPKAVIERASRIDMTRGTGRTCIGVSIVCVAQLIPRKNISFLLKEFSLAGDRDKACLFLVGSGPQENELRSTASGLGIAENTFFLGQRNDALNIIKSAGLLILPSIHDDCPLALIESLCLGTPCMTSKTGGMPEILKYDELMFEQGKPGELSKKLERFIGDASYRELLKRLCAERKKEFDKDWGEEVLKLLV